MIGATAELEVRQYVPSARYSPSTLKLRACGDDGGATDALSLEQACAMIAGEEEVRTGGIGEVKEIGVVGIVAGMLARNWLEIDG